MFETAATSQNIIQHAASPGSRQQLHPTQNENSPVENISATKLKPAKYRTISDRSSSRYFIHTPVEPEDWLKGAPGAATERLRADFLPFLRFDLMMDYYQLRPVKVFYRNSLHTEEIYQPLVLLTYRRDIAPAMSWQPILADIWSRDDLKGNWSWMRDAWREARRFAREKNWRFLIFTEDFFATPFYQNVRFLLPYMKLTEREEFEQRLYLKMKELEMSRVHHLLEAATDGKDEYAALVPSLWRMIARYDLRCDLKLPLTMKTEVWPG